MFTSSRIPLHTYGRLQLLLVDKDGLNETHSITEYESKILSQNYLQQPLMVQSFRCRDVDDLLTSGSQIEKLLVAHPAIIPVEAHILYVAYDGWIYSGRFQWSLDKLILTDVDGKKKSFCKENGQYLPSGIPVKLKLKSGDCVTNSLKAPPDYPIAPFRKVEIKALVPQIGISTVLFSFSIPKSRTTMYLPDCPLAFPTPHMETATVTHIQSTSSRQARAKTSSTCQRREILVPLLPQQRRSSNRQRPLQSLRRSRQGSHLHRSQ